METSRILIVEDDKSTRELLTIFLAKEGYKTSSAQEAAEALSVLSKGDYQLILLDIMMPKMDGFEFIKKVREFSNIPIVFLTARGNQEDKIKGFLSGCDDYITKPFDLTELGLRLSAIIKRTFVATAKSNEGIIAIRDIAIYINEHIVCKDGETLKFTPKEFDILLLLAKNKGRVFSSEEIFERVWGEKFLESDNSILTHIRNIREKLGDSVKNPKYIKTMWGVGYKIEKDI